MGGTFTGSKILPGTYVRYKSKKTTSPGSAVRGIAVVPLIGYDWGGASAAMVRIDSDSPDANLAQIGRSVYADDAIVRLIALALENAETVYAYIPASTTKATKTETFSTNNSLTVTAKYGGTRGNDITVSVVARTDSGFDVSVLVDGVEVEKFEKVANMTAIAALESEWVVFTGQGTLGAVASMVLTGGADVSPTASTWTDYLDALEGITFNTAAVPTDTATVQSAAISKVNSMRDNAGKTVQFVMPNNAANNVGIINVSNSFAYSDSDQLTVGQACAWVAGAEAGADKVTSNTYKVVPNADRVVGALTVAGQEAAVKAGQLFFITDDAGTVVVCYDINSLVSPSADQDLSYRKNRVVHTLDSFADDLRLNIKPNMFNNNDEGWSLMEGIGRNLLMQYQADNAIMNVNPEEDFFVDKTRTSGDECYFEVGIQPVDSAEKLYFTINTR